MRDSNLAYNHSSSYHQTRYRETQRETRVKEISNIRSAGGVMIRKGSAKQLKLNTATKHGKKPQIKRGTVIAVLVLAAMAFAVLFRGLMLTSGSEQLEAKKVQLSDTLAANQKLQFKIDQTLDLKNMEDIAHNTFGMDQPTKAQTVYISLDQTDEVKKVRETNSVLDGIKNFFAGIVEYFR